MSVTITETNSTGTTVYHLTQINPTGLALVATSGSYNDLTNKPTIPAAQKNANWNSTAGVTAILNKPNLAVVATSGSYNDLKDKPNIPVYQNLATVATSGSYIDLSNKPIIPVMPTLAIVATSGNYNDLSNKPTIPVIPTLAIVATSGKYSDLTGLPVITPQVNPDWNSTIGVSTILNKPTTLAGYGITDAVVSSLTPTNTKPSSHTLTIVDRDTQININSSSPATVTIPLNSKVPFLNNSQLLVCQYGTGAVTIVGETGVTVRSSGGKKIINDQYSVVSLKKLATNEWLLVGNLK